MRFLESFFLQQKSKKCQVFKFLSCKVFSKILFRFIEYICVLVHFCNNYFTTQTIAANIYIFVFEDIGLQDLRKMNN